MATAPMFDGSQLCSKTDPDLFFPETPEIDKQLPEREKRRLRKIYNKKLKEEEATAKNICNGCRFFKDCLDYAINTDVVGIWAGTNEKERKELRIKLGIKKPESLSLSISRAVK